MTAIPVEALHTVTAKREPLSCDNDPLIPAAAAGYAAASRRRSCTLDLSRTRTHDAVLLILRAYKLTGNFHNNLETVLKDMGLFYMVAYSIEPGKTLAFPDCRHVVFTLNDNVPDAMLGEIARSIKARIGFDVPWWGGLLRHRGVH
jgi:hypothetical protein